MSRTALFCFSVFLLSASAVLLSTNACGGAGSTISQGKINHVVIIVQENRTPDNLFHGLPNADIANTGVNSRGQTIALAPISLANSYDLGHRHADFVLMYDNGKMDGADKVTACARPTRSSSMCNPRTLFPTSNLRSNIPSATACSRRIKGPVSRRTSSFFQVRPRPVQQATYLPPKIPT
jgi:hypothetical protein